MTWRDWWRGWSDGDLESVFRKIRGAAPGAIIPLTSRELRAHVDYFPAAIAHGVKAADLHLIDQIFDVRVKNNMPWKRLMQISLKHAPEETKAALREINANDRAISDLLVELAK